jgi:hypothetical protein
MKDEDDLRELRELLQQYAEATAEERKHLRPGIEHAISKVLPGLLDTADTRFFNGDYLKDMFDQCMKRALARSDLSPDRKTNAREDADDFTAFFNGAKQWQVPKLAAHAFEMATLALLTGLRAGPNPAEIDDLRARFLSERQRKVAEKGVEDRRNKEWRKFAKDETLRLHRVNSLLTLTEIAEKIIKEWEPFKFEKVKQQQLFRYLSRLMDKNELPSSITRRARTSRQGE